MTEAERAVIEAARASVFAGQAYRSAQVRTALMDSAISNRFHLEQSAERCEAFVVLALADVALIAAVERLEELEAASCKLDLSE